MAPSACAKPAKHNTVSKTNRCVHKIWMRLLPAYVCSCVCRFTRYSCSSWQKGRLHSGKREPLTVISIAGSHLADCLCAHTHKHTQSSLLSSQQTTHNSTDPQLSQQEAPTSLNHLLTVCLHQHLLMGVLHPTKPIDYIEIKDRWCIEKSFTGSNSPL